MGTSQTFLLVLCFVILGLALATGLDFFKSQRRQAEMDRVTLDMTRIAHAIQVWKLEPAERDGGREKDLAEVEFSRVYYGTAPCDAMAGPLGAGETCYFQEQELRYILQPEDTNVRVVALSRDIGYERNEYRLAEALVTGIHPDDVQVTMIR